MKKIISILLIVICSLPAAQAQKQQFDNFNTLRNAAAIKQGQDIKGYYFFYETDKIDKRTNEYMLQILDVNLSKIKEIKMQGTLDVLLIQSSFNGAELIFGFLNSEKKSLEYHVYGANGEKKFSYEQTYSKTELEYIKALVLMRQSESHSVYGPDPIEGKGFLTTLPALEKMHQTYQAVFYSSVSKQNWTYIPSFDGKFCSGSYLGSADGILYIKEIRGEKARVTKDPDGFASFLVGLDAQTGKKVFEKSTTGSKYKTEPFEIELNEKGQAVVIGEYNSLDKNIYREKAPGYSYWTLDNKGNLVDEKYWNQQEVIEKYLGAGKAQEAENLHLGSVIHMADGAKFMIGTRHESKGNRFDIAIARLNKDIEITEMKFFPVRDNTVAIGLYFSSSALSPSPISRFYENTYQVVDAENSSFIIYYSDVLNGKRYDEGSLRAVSYQGGKITEDNIKLKTKTNQPFLLPANDGQMLVMDYFPKEKRLELHLEKMN